MTEPVPDLQQARRILAQRLESLQRAGVLQIGKVPPPLVPRAGAGSASPLARSASEAASRGVAPTQRTTPLAPAPALDPEMARARLPKPPPLSVAMLKNDPYPADLAESRDQRVLALEAIDQQVRVCTLCKELACTRTKTVFGIGNVMPRVAFFGEAPGADEDRTGEPFVGRAGQLLTKIIKACTFKREDVYILNVLKCRPPENRTPLPEEMAHCRGYFERQFEVLRPEYIVCAGSVAAQALLETTEPIGKLRGRFHTYRGSKVVATYHPSYLLRNPAAKKFVWDDMQMLLADMGIPLPGKQA